MAPVNGRCLLRSALGCKVPVSVLGDFVWSLLIKKKAAERLDGVNVEPAVADKLYTRLCIMQRSGDYIKYIKAVEIVSPEDSIDR